MLAKNNIVLSSLLILLKMVEVEFISMGLHAGRAANQREKRV